jgi:cytochrome P450 family 2 subfamily U polypeptide 1
MDARYWPNPSKFDPSRFLDNDGKVREHVAFYFPFGLGKSSINIDLRTVTGIIVMLPHHYFKGKRQCLGESISKMELFIYMAVFLHRFNFSFSEAFPRAVNINATDPLSPYIVRVPYKMKFIATERS